MYSLTSGLSDAIEYIEENLTEHIDIGEAARRAYMSSFYFQKVFAALCGFTVSEYIRNRRLTLASQELVSGAKVIDVAYKYGYNSPDSFAKAFTAFHGVSPSLAKRNGTGLNSVAPLKIKVVLQGGIKMEFKIVEKAQFTLMGKKRRFDCDTSYSKIPEFWKEFMSGDDKAVCGMYGLCKNVSDNEFDYYIADNYIPSKDVPEGYETVVIPAGTWAVFPCRGALPKALQDVNTKIWSEWLPSCKKYKLAGSYDIEFYTQDDEYCEIWIPLEKI